MIITNEAFIVANHVRFGIVIGFKITVFFV